MQDVTELEAAMRTLFRTLKRPQFWSLVTTRAGIDIDRPAAMMLHILVMDPAKHYRGQDLAKRLSIEAPSVTRKAQELERAGYINRIPDEKDRRAVYLEITTAGKIASSKLWEAQRSLTNEALYDWDPADRTVFITLFSRFADDIARVANLN